MSLHQKVDGTWLEAQRVYVKRSGVWRPADQAWVKRGGVWVRAYNYDVTPPDKPLMSLEVIDKVTKGTLTGRWIKVGIRDSHAAHQNDIRRIRVLTTFNGKQPTSHLGGTYTNKPDDTFPNEPWSDFSYNGHNGITHRDTSDWKYKQWPRNPKATTKLKGGETYHFSAWAEDFEGNWSLPTHMSIRVPKGSTASKDFVLHETLFSPNSSGTISSGGAYQAGDLVQQHSKGSRGVFFYGAQFPNSIRGAKKIRRARIRLTRTNDSGPATANVYIYRHDSGSDPSGVSRTGNQVLGKINKGETKWFDLPEGYHQHLMDRNIRGFGLNFKHPDKAAGLASDYSVIRGVGSRSGDVHVIWEA